MFNGHQDRTTPFAADTESLCDSEHDKRNGGPHSPVRV
jgi:hypothetical protein